MFNIDLEKKIKDLNEGTYYKTLNGKSYEIHVKNTEHGNKVINVYYKSNLIIDLNYYKDGKIMKEGIEMKDDDKNYSLNEVINKMINLSEGYAKLDNMSICVKESKKIDDSSSTSFKVEIEDENYNYDFSIPFTNEYYINIKSKNMDFNFFTKKDKTTNEIDNRSITFIYKDKKYALTSNTLTNLYDEKKYTVKDNNLITKIDEKYYIAYDFTNNKVYVYIKKNDAVNNDLENDYVKIPYAKNLNKVGNVCNELFNVFKNKVKDKVEDKVLLSLHAYYASEQYDTKTEIDKFLVRIKEYCIDKDIPVMLTEFGTKKTYGDEDERAYIANYYVLNAKKIGIPCFWWDDGSNYILFNRRNLNWEYEKIKDAIISGSNMQAIY